jgi:hypothetical protein
MELKGRIVDVLFFFLNDEWGFKKVRGERSDDDGYNDEDGILAHHERAG